MPPYRDQLEIIKPNGEVEFFDLNSDRGITNIGQHPDNDIVIDSPEVAPFHAVLDHRQRPCRLVVLSHTGQTMLGDQLLPPNVSTPVQNMGRIRLGEHTLMLIEGQAPAPGAAPGLAAAVPYSPQAGPGPASLPPTTRPEELPVQRAGQDFAQLPPDQTDDLIITEIEERTQTVFVEQSAAYQISLVNGGDIVAMFQVDVQGAPDEWVQLSASQVNLYEGQRATVTITVTPPRAPTSQAGPHYLAIVVTSPNYPDRRSLRAVTLTIQPYYEFTVGELSPKRQAISWFTESGQARFSITNNGNGPAPFRVQAEDDERGCNFEFEVPGEPVGLVRQADLQLASEETVFIPVSITPIKRKLIGLRRRSYSYTVTTTLLEGQNTPRSQLGELKTGPLIGPLLILLSIFLSILLVIYIFWPDINLNAHPNSITAGQEVTLSWNAFPPFFIEIALNDEPVEAPRGSLEDRPLKTTSYEVTANTWLSTIFPLIAGRDSRVVQVTPVRPAINLFAAAPAAINPGQDTVLSWFVVGSDELTLVNNTNGEAETLTSPSGSRKITLEEDTSFTLRALSASLPDTPEEQSVSVSINTPTPEIQEAPVIQFFLVQPRVITAGQTVTLQWAVAGVDSVSLQPIGEGLPPVGPPISHMPQETTLYVLSADNGQEKVNAVQQVEVLAAATPTPAATPGAPPVIEFVGVTPKEWVRVDVDDRGSEDNEITSQVNWVVTGRTTNVELSGGPPGFEKFSNLPRKGEISIKVRDTTVFVLTAYNGEESVVKTTQIEFLDPTPTPEPEGGGADGGGGGGGDGGGGGGGDGGGEGPDPPEIDTFEAAGVSGSDQVTLVGGNPPVYEVTAGSNVNLSWAASNVDTVTLVGVGDQPPAGTHTLSNVIADQTFQLTATNEAGSAQSFLRLRVVQGPPPPPPYNVFGTEAGSNIIVTWDYDAENEIIGFRVYRANNLGPFTRVATEDDLGNGSRQWVDVGALPGCRGYYVAGVYVDPLSGDELETAASTNVWYSSGCP